MKNKQLQKPLEIKGDIHKQVASLIFNIPIENVTQKQRQYAKHVTYSYMYGGKIESLYNKENTIIKQIGEKNDN